MANMRFLWYKKCRRNFNDIFNFLMSMIINANIKFNLFLYNLQWWSWGKTLPHTERCIFKQIFLFTKTQRKLLFFAFKWYQNKNYPNK